jgi:hypothetical protein
MQSSEQNGRRNEDPQVRGTLLNKFCDGLHGVILEVEVV